MWNECQLTLLWGTVPPSEDLCHPQSGGREEEQESGSGNCYHCPKVVSPHLSVRALNPRELAQL